MKTLLIMLSIPILNQAFSKDINSVTITTQTTIKASPKDAFEYIVPIDLSHIFKRYRNLPAVTHTNNEQHWYTPGMERTVFFEDGNSAKEQLITVIPHSSFSYQIDHFTSFLKRLAIRIEGNWVFTPTPNGDTTIEWTYSIFPKSTFSRLIIVSLVKKNVAGLLNNALTILKNDLEK